MFDTTSWGTSILLDSYQNCEAYFVRVRAKNVGNPEFTNKGSSIIPVCQPIGYTEPDPICSAGTYDPASDTCQ